MGGLVIGQAHTGEVMNQDHIEHYISNNGQGIGLNTVTQIQTVISQEENGGDDHAMWQTTVHTEDEFEVTRRQRA